MTGRERDNRRHLRTPMHAVVRLIDARGKAHRLTLGDLSDGGIFVETPDGLSLAVGEQVAVQVQGLPVEAPVQPMRVVRISPKGIGLQFIDP
ncbi:MAG: PilZ domain-containing protein [Pseudomonadota bacterium]|nr:PilZ domain-containing protein [Pseudomonadota bacterium]